MEKLPCSIFNDVLGPVMRGPSSSHVAGAARIASMIRQSRDCPGDSEAVRRAFSGGRGAVGVIRNIVKGQLQFV